MERYPLYLVPVSKENLWGGHRLKDAYGKTAPFEKLAESWELTVRPDGMCRIGNGAYSGMTLGEYLASSPDAVSPRWDGDRFPLLIKYIDARDRLSVQVHPDDGYARVHEGDAGKTELWHILEAGPEASLVYGLRAGTTVGAFADAVQGKRITELLHTIPVRAGETYFIPAGQLHAIGAGILLAEIQENSNITYRVYDYDRRQADGTLRALHTKKALDVVRIRTEEEIDELRFAHGARAPHVLADCAAFRAERPPLPCVIRQEERFNALLCVSGHGVLRCGDTVYPMRQGDTYFLPCGCPPCIAEGDAAVLTAQSNL